MEAIESAYYVKWIGKIKDRRAVLRIDARIEQICAHGHLFGDIKPVGSGVYELRIHFGPGYRIYVSPEQNDLLLLLLAGGDKSTQQCDIDKAIAIAKEWRNGNGHMEEMGSE